MHFGVQEGRVGLQNDLKNESCEASKAQKSSSEVQGSGLKVQKSSLEVQSRKPVQPRVQDTAEIKPESAKGVNPLPPAFPPPTLPPQQLTFSSSVAGSSGISHFRVAFGSLKS